LARSVWPKVVRLAVGDVGARPFLAAYPEMVTLVPCDGTGRPDDIDTPGQLGAAADRLQ
jgi:CTP:molybdopterin cytidylyltransferase MocA